MLERQGVRERFARHAERSSIGDRCRLTVDLVDSSLRRIGTGDREQRRRRDEVLVFDDPERTRAPREHEHRRVR